MRHLQIRHTSPLEREFEAWIVAGIEEYFESLGIVYSVFAVSPDLEPIWPADERILTNGKVFGLQFKQAKLSGSSQPLPAQLKWSLHSPAPQFNQVLATPEVYYCLPTFINRDYRKQALEHCVFWRPNPQQLDKNAWYNNPGAHTPYKQLESEARWGLFVEQVFNCNIGRRISSASKLAEYVHEIRAHRAHRAIPDSPTNGDQPSEQEAVYVVAVSLET
ncbi:MAG: hypothetical protein WA930_03030 [Rhodanobacter sp.]